MNFIEVLGIDPRFETFLVAGAGAAIGGILTYVHKSKSKSEVVEKEITTNAILKGIADLSICNIYDDLVQIAEFSQRAKTRVEYQTKEQQKYEDIANKIVTNQISSWEEISHLIVVENHFKNLLSKIYIELACISDKCKLSYNDSFYRVLQFLTSDKTPHYGGSVVDFIDYWSVDFIDLLGYKVGHVYNKDLPKKFDIDLIDEAVYVNFVEKYKDSFGGKDSAHDSMAKLFCSEKEENNPTHEHEDNTERYSWYAWLAIVGISITLPIWIILYAQNQSLPVGYIHAHDQNQDASATEVKHPAPIITTLEQEREEVPILITTLEQEREEVPILPAEIKVQTVKVRQCNTNSLYYERCLRKAAAERRRAAKQPSFNKDKKTTAKHSVKREKRESCLTTTAHKHNDGFRISSINCSFWYQNANEFIKDIWVESIVYKKIPSDEHEPVKVEYNLYIQGDNATKLIGHYVKYNMNRGPVYTSEIKHSTRHNAVFFHIQNEHFITRAEREYANGKIQHHEYIGFDFIQNFMLPELDVDKIKIKLLVAELLYMVDDTKNQYIAYLEAQQ